MGVNGWLQAPAVLPPETLYGTRCIGGWMRPRAGLDALANRKKSLQYSCWEMEPSSSRLLSSHYADWSTQVSFNAVLELNDVAVLGRSHSSRLLVFLSRI